MDEFDEFMSLLDTYKNIDEFVGELTSAEILMMSNEDPDVRVINVMDHAHLHMVVSDYLGDGNDVIQLVVKSETEYPLCTHFKLIMSDHGRQKGTNYKLERFMRMTGIKKILPRCHKAVVVGLDGPLGSLVNIPASLSSGFFSEIGPILSTEVVDTTGEFKCDWLIYRYLSHPTSWLIKDAVVESAIVWFDKYSGLFELDYM